MRICNASLLKLMDLFNNIVFCLPSPEVGSSTRMTGRSESISAAKAILFLSP